MPRATREERLAKKLDQQAKIAQDVQKLRASLNHTARKKDARGKILVGAGILSAIKREVLTAEGTVAILREEIPDPRNQALLKELYGLPF